MIRHPLCLTALIGGAFTFGACQTSSALRPATLEQTTPETMQTVTRVLAEAVGRARVELGPGDLTRTSVISVLPPAPTPLEGNSPAMPSVFDIVLADDECFVMERSTGALHLLEGVACRLAP